MQADLRLEFRSQAWPFNLILLRMEVRHMLSVSPGEQMSLSTFLNLLKRKLVHKK